MRCHMKKCFIWLLFIWIALLIYLFIISPQQSFQNEAALPMLEKSERDTRQSNRVIRSTKAERKPSPPPVNPNDPAGVLSSAAHNGDRILEQLNLRIPRPRKVLEIKVYPDVPSDTLEGGGQFIKDQCNVKSCRLSSLTREGGGDVVLWREMLGWEYSRSRPFNGQLWGMFMLESPMSMMLDIMLGDGEIITQFNFTATYRSDSTIVTPYERFVTFTNSTELPKHSKINYARGKSRLVAAFISNCSPSNKREEYIKELQQHIDVHVYGYCGNYTCDRFDREGCFNMLKENYKFYLAFENANCRDYISEKFYWNALWNDVVPVVMGASLQSVVKAAPPESFIHVDHFSSPKRLAHYLKMLDKNDEKYNEYFRWKGTGEFINTKFWCRLCAMSHYMQTYPDEPRDIVSWWKGSKKSQVCVPDHHNNTWQSWKHYEKQLFSPDYSH